jgi:hypothetical protein
MKHLKRLHVTSGNTNRDIAKQPSVRSRAQAQEARVAGELPRPGASLAVEAPRGRALGPGGKPR